MSAISTLDPTCEVLRSAARDDSTHAGWVSETLFRLIETGQMLSLWVKRELARCHLTETGFRLLAQLLTHEDAGLTPANLSASLGLPPRIVSATLGRLELSGLISRRRSTGDRRTFVLRITPEGVRVFHTAFEHCLREMNRAVTHLHPRELTQLDRTCRQLRQAFSNHPSNLN